MKTTDVDLSAGSETDMMVRDAIEMIGIRTSNPPGDELHLARWLADRARAVGMSADVVEIADGRGNCIATADFGPGPTLVMCTHLDVVPATKESAWVARVQDGRLHGRGACDAKGPLAAMLAACARLTANPDMRGRLILAAVADEETGATGALHYAAHNGRADGVIIGEPTDNRPVLSSRGALRLAIDFDGQPSHSSTPDSGRNAVHAAARFVVAGEEYHRRLADSGLFATHAATVINGGTKLNIIPESCRVLVDRRLAPSETLTEALAEIEQILQILRKDDPDLSWRISPAGVWLAPFELSADDGFGSTILRAVGANSPGPTFPGGTDAPHFIANGTPAVILGPGSLAQAHSHDEWVEVAQLVQAVDLYERCGLALLSTQSN